MRKHNEIELYKDVTRQEWNDWHWQVKNRVTTVEQLKKIINLTAEEESAIDESLALLRMSITPYYASLMDPDHRDCPIRKQAVPTSLELHRGGGYGGPLHEDTDSPVEGLTHRYPDRCYCW